MEPLYLELHRRGELQGRAEKALAALQSCEICPRQCKIDRLRDERKECQTGRWAQVSSVGPHFGEESPLVGMRGSGTVFFSGCNLKCLFCQNYDISHNVDGREVSAAQLAANFLEVQQMGCHNLNVVTPTHVTPQILESLVIAVEEGLRLPIVYNCGGYESLETLKLLDGVVDIYMPDLKFVDQEPAKRFCNAANYPSVVKRAFKEMHRQVGVLQLNDQGIAERGVLVQHLVMPADLAGTAEAMRFLAEELSPDTYVNVMAQYRPCFRAFKTPPIDRSITDQEFDRAVELARNAGLTRLDGFGEFARRRRVFWLL